ncbi:hypothetical protein [Streptomyces profundus]|uniref:hypothetical protein n=1 Tax=Streptomyces profundus TaxID=2867410 RepID=UPI001D165901|nr:hypothetical protein [Streptomyces sp. MA3_2.13]UED87366.1 hypothetical protein K4G22_26750 [Streptomyces sp. MA3_2.13]
MRSTLFSVTGALCLSAAVFTLPAHAATGEVSVFSTELSPVTTYQDPAGCQKLPLDAHVLTNNTDAPVRGYGDPFCLTPSLTVEPGYGSHVAPGTGSFSA